MSNRKAKRKMIKEFGVEKFSDIVKRKLKGTSESSRRLRSNKALSGSDKETK